MVVVNFPHIFLEVLGNISRFLRNVNGTSGKRKHTHFFFGCLYEFMLQVVDDIHYQAKVLYHNSMM